MNNLEPLNYWLFAMPFKKNEEHFRFLIKLRQYNKNGYDYLLDSNSFYRSPEFLFQMSVHQDLKMKELGRKYLFQHAEDTVEWALRQINSPFNKDRSRELLRLLIIVLRDIMGDFSGMVNHTLSALCDHIPEEFHPMIEVQFKYLRLGGFSRRKYGHLPGTIAKNIKLALEKDTYLKTSHP
jgi:hypothetical protein